MSDEEIAARIPFEMVFHITEDALKGYGSSRYRNKDLNLGAESHTRRKTKRYFYLEDQNETYTSLADLLKSRPCVRAQAEALYCKEGK